MPIKPNLLERTAFYTLNIGPAPMLDLAGALAYHTLSLASQLNVFSALKDRTLSPAELGDELDTQMHGMQVLLHALEAMGYVIENNGRYTNSAMTEKWLLDGSDIDFDSLLLFWNEVFRDLWPHAADVFRSGNRVLNFYEWVESNPERNQSFQKTLSTNASIAGDDVVKKLALPNSAVRLLDVGGGHGLHTINLCRHYPNLRAVIIDSPAALRAARQNIAASHLEDRIELCPGDLWEVDWGMDHDLVLVFNVIHQYDLNTTERLLQKVSGSLRSGGMVAILDQIAGKVTGSATSALIRLVALQYYLMVDGRVYTSAEIQDLLDQTGFINTRIHKLSKLPGNSLFTAVSK